MTGARLARIAYAKRVKVVISFQRTINATSAALSKMDVNNATQLILAKSAPRRQDTFSIPIQIVVDA